MDYIRQRPARVDNSRDERIETMEAGRIAQSTFMVGDADG